MIGVTLVILVRCLLKNIPHNIHKGYRTEKTLIGYQRLANLLMPWNYAIFNNTDRR
jgi:hypothetical protein